MKARKMLGMWLALALVAVAGLVLTGCPHNNLMDRGEAVGGGSGRSGNKGVQLVITNFIQDTGSTASYLNPLRTISPGHINLKDQLEVDKYVFIVEGTGNGTSFGPEFIDIDGATGMANLGIGGFGFWEVTVQGYDVEKLKVPLAVNNKNDIVTTKKPTEVTAEKATALVLQGQSTLDLNTGARITMTLTNDGVGTEGDVLLEINFDTPSDVTTIDTSDYVVKAALYDFTTKQIVSTPTGQAETQLRDSGAGDRLANPETFNVIGVKKGRYQFRLTVIDNADNSVQAYWSDDIYIEGNRTTQKEINVQNLFSEKPSDPTAFEVYWTVAPESELKDGFLATFTWSGLSYNAVGVNIQIADITEWYQYDMLQSQHKFNNFNTSSDQIDRTTLWDKIEALSDATVPKKTDVVTEITWDNSPQNATRYPAIYRNGSQLNGNSEVTFLMQHGHVYTARIQAAGAQTNSGWVVIGTGAAPAAGLPTKFILPSTTGLFDLVQIKYDLENGKYLLKQTPDGLAIGTDATNTNLLQHTEYKEPVATPIDINLKYSLTGMVTPQPNDWFLYSTTTPPTQLDERIRSWKGWRDTVGTTEITPDQNWQYAGYKSLQLVALAGSSVNTQAETSDTFNVLDKNKVLVKLENDGAQGNKNNWDELINGDTNPTPGAGGIDPKNTGLALKEDAAKNRFIINLKRGGTPQTWLYVSAGADATDTKVGILQDKNQNDFTVKDITVTLSQGGVDYKTFTKDAGGYSAHAQLDGLRSGDYTLRVKILTSSGYEESYQTTLVVKYDDQVIQ